MSKKNESTETMNAEFNGLVGDMKPYIIKHPNESERQHCALWIKKLSDPATCGSSLNGHSDRNLYARLLLQMLKRGVLEGPFASKPEPGNLKTLPNYMSIYFDEPINSRPVDHCKATLPDWVTGELVGCTNDSLAAGLPKNTSSPRTAYISQLSKEKTPRGGAPASSPLKHSPRHEARAGDGGRVSLDDSDLEARLNSWNLRVCKPSFARSGTTDEVDLQLLQSKEVDMRVKILESKHLEEKLKMQQRHDATVDKILERKNAEIEETTTLFRAQQQESEEMIHKLERKVQSMLKESKVICESKDTQIAELKKMTDQSADALKIEFERKLHAVVSDMEQEKFELQKKHMDNIQEVLENTKIRLAKMESDYNARSQSTMQIVCELEQQTKQQSAEVEKSNNLCQKATQEKAQLEIHLASINVELQEANRSFMVLQKDKDEQSVLFEQTLQKFQAKHQADVNHLQKEHTLSVAKASAVMEDLEKTISELKQQLLVSEHHRQTQARDQDLKFQQEKDDLQISYNAKVQALQSEVDKERTEDRRKMDKLEDALRDMEKQLDRTRENHRLQLQQADVALEQFRRQVKLSSEKAEAELKFQMEKVEEDLQRSRCLRENQTKEFSQQLDGVRESFEQQMAEQRAKHEQERTRLQQQHCAEKERLVQERQREVGSLESQARAALEQHQKHTQEWRKRDGQTIANLEAQLARWREELHLARVQHKQQLAEAAALREEERQKAHLDKEAALKRLCSDMEGSRSHLERSHQQEKDAAEEKTSSKLKHMEKEYNQKLARSAQIIGELQQSLCNSKEEVVTLQQTMKRQLEEAEDRWAQERKDFNKQANLANKVMVELQQSVCSSNEEAVSLQQTLKRQLEEARQGWLQERRTMTQQAQQANKALQEKVESLQRRLHSTEKTLLSKELETEEKVTMVCQKYENKMKGLIPAELRQELEDTITSLKYQVDFLQKRASVLQEDLDTCRRKR
ncbi:centrosomal protein of 112 kDa isoform X2 [Nerophis ophidion]|uniref:centrosomal protein of 112 kDa isoform X2 n=1 Tax=Nerophis ophidion TaxID=159077 RepID=UPI002AE01688|nr:centrosomal protein of 112 kDa isoform X2 [Nerophis ophidion]